ncbi:Uncharacterized protein Fot_45307 [Forsythia ovata]|uniref:Uncharacterized protein n=1 Tax=Forsythia ovata TaxID=205694 RepID=A0ABD1R7S9_9LAMI
MDTSDSPFSATSIISNSIPARSDAMYLEKPSTGLYADTGKLNLDESMVDPLNYQELQLLWKQDMASLKLPALEKQTSDDILTKKLDNFNLSSKAVSMNEQKPKP